MSDNRCLFCAPEHTILSNELVFARYDDFPVSEGHMLLIPHRHVANYFEMTPEEKEAMWSLLDEAKGLLDREKQPDGYNIGVNCGPVAGQSVMHAHLHLIPRYPGDVTDPRGGVRAVIPAKQRYHDQLKAGTP
jgi:diadenosine tetraphosphate (Ap4A) HIT family hydrolase